MRVTTYSRMSGINGQTKTEKKIPMQIMTFPLSREVDLGIRMTEIRRIETLRENSDPGEARLFFPHDWFDLPRPDKLTGLKGIFLSSYREALIAVPRIGRILRLADPSLSGTLHADHSFLSKHKTVEGPEFWVLDIPLLRNQFSGEGPAVPVPDRQTGEASELFQQMGQTARDIQRVLSLSSSMVDSLKFMEGKLPETSQGLGVISQMTEDAAHKLMNILESLLEDHNQIRAIAQSKDGPSPDRIAGILDEADERIMHGFEAMAFQDLVGQNIKLIGSHLKELESRLVRILIETSPEANRSGDESGTSSSAATPPSTPTLKGVGAHGDIDQNTVDQLLSEFGF